MYYANNLTFLSTQLVNRRLDTFTRCVGSLVGSQDGTATNNLTITNIFLTGIMNCVSTWWMFGVLVGIDNNGWGYISNCTISVTVIGGCAY